VDLVGKSRRHSPRRPRPAVLSLSGDAAIPKLEELFEMSKKDLLTRKGAVALGALMIALKPKLAMDAKD